MEGSRNVFFFRGTNLFSVCKGYLNPRRSSGRRICYGVAQVWCSGANNSLTSRVFGEYIEISHNLITPCYYFIFLRHPACRTLCILSLCESSFNKLRSEQTSYWLLSFSTSCSLKAKHRHAVHVLWLSRWHNSLCADISDWKSMWFHAFSELVRRETYLNEKRPSYVFPI